jgi:hypothetical protein
MAREIYLHVGLQKLFKPKDSPPLLDVQFQFLALKDFLDQLDEVVWGIHVASWLCAAFAKQQVSNLAKSGVLIIVSVANWQLAQYDLNNNVALYEPAIIVEQV